jgi:hypothetical protein
LSGFGADCTPTGVFLKVALAGQFITGIHTYCTSSSCAFPVR